MTEKEQRASAEKASWPSGRLVEAPGRIGRRAGRWLAEEGA